jgi:hypothetical protein
VIPKLPDLPSIPLHERTRTVELLLKNDAQLREVIALQGRQLALQQERLALQEEQLTLQQEQLARQKEHIQALKDEIARLKGQKPKPNIRPSALEQDGKKRKDKKQRSSTKRSKTAQLEIHDTVVVPPTDEIPEGSRFNGYADFTVVGLKFQPFNVRYRLQMWLTPEGDFLKGEIPEHVKAMGGHFSSELASFIQHQHYHAHVPQNLILEQLHDIGVEISEGQLNRILLEKKDSFHTEKESLLQVGLEVSPYIQTDDTGARHKGHNGYCTHVGNAWFAYFASTSSKSRINFLEILRAGHTDYVLDSYALEYMRDQKLPKKVLRFLEGLGDTVVPNDSAWTNKLREWGIATKRHVKIVTEGALLGSVLSHEINPNLVVLSDDAGQFDVLLHALCWVHAERLLAKLIGFSAEQRAALETKRSQVWDLYRALKVYKNKPTVELRQELVERFDAIFQETTCFATLNHALKRLYDNKAELLLVLERPDIPLHNNLSENDIREYVMRRKRSGSTRSDLGRLCRDTFASLKKTCRKLGISFWHYLMDRNSGSNTIPPLSDLVRQRAEEARA